MLVLPIPCTASGYSEFFSRETTKTQNEQIFHSLSQVQLVPDVNRPLPNLYTAEPKILPAKAGVAVFYFTRHHPPATLADLLRSPLVDRVSPNPAAGRPDKESLRVDESSAAN